MVNYNTANEQNLTDFMLRCYNDNNSTIGSDKSTDSASPKLSS